MKKSQRSLLFLTLLGLAVAFTRPEPDHPSLTSEVLATYTPKRTGSPAAAARALLEALNEERRGECQQVFDSPYRSQWTNTPPRDDEDGVRLGDCEREGIERACDLLTACLSEEGYAKVRDVMLADDKLLRNGRPRRGFGAENFWLGLFGEPDEQGDWGLQLDGHHIALNLAFAGERMSMSPSFVGTQPSKYSRDGETVVPLLEVTRRAHALLESLSEGHRDIAIFSPHRKQLETGVGHDGEVPKVRGLDCSLLDEGQRELLLELIEAYVRDLPPAHAGARMEEVRAEIPRMHFAWFGKTEEPADMSYRIQGPTVLIEFACQDLGGDPLNHLHTMYRNPRNEYGMGFAD